MPVLRAQQANRLEHRLDRRPVEEIVGDAYLIGLRPGMRPLDRHVLDVAPIDHAAQGGRFRLHAEVRHDGIVPQDLVGARRQARHLRAVAVHLGKVRAHDLHLLNRGDGGRTADRHPIDPATQDRREKAPLWGHGVCL